MESFSDDNIDTTSTEIDILCKEEETAFCRFMVLLHVFHPASGVCSLTVDSSVCGKEGYPVSSLRFQASIVAVYKSRPWATTTKLASLCNISSIGVHPIGNTCISQRGEAWDCVSVPRGTYVLSHRFEVPLPNAIRNACCMAFKVEVTRILMQALLFKSKLSISR